jgi:hypothetical protein
MYPGESWKYSVAATRQSGFEAVDAAGERGTDAGPTFRDTLALSLSKAVTPRLSVTGVLPFEQNLHPDAESDRALADPTLAARWSALPGDFSAPWRPEIAATAAFKKGLAKSLRETEDEHAMDVHGNGYDEVAAGFDLFWGMTAAKLGVSAQALVPLERTIDGVTTRPEPGARSALAVGYGWMGTGQLLAVVEREAQGALVVDGETVDDSERTANATRVVGTLAAGPRRTIGVTWKRTAAFGGNKNTTRSDGVSVAWTQSL